MLSLNDVAGGQAEPVSPIVSVHARDVRTTADALPDIRLPPQSRQNMAFRRWWPDAPQTAPVAAQ
jgi:hypothetical protein